MAILGNSVVAKNNIWQFGKFVSIGAVAAIVNLALIFSLVEFLHAGKSLSSLVAASGGILANFILQKIFVFSQSDYANHWSKQLVLFALLGLINIALNSFIFFFIYSVLGWWYLLAQMVSIGLLSLFNFIISKKFIFISAESK